MKSNYFIFLTLPKPIYPQVLKYMDMAIGLAEHAGCVRLGLGSPALDIEQTVPGRQQYLLSQ